tara:strand:- start:554 stop:1210 length:657 start_codon:yes stop_codon:yes gene_type:complete
MAGLVVDTAPTQEPVTLQEVKEYLRIDDATDERVVRPFIESARRFCEEHTGRALMSQTLILYLDAFQDMDNPLWEGMRTGPYLNYYKNYIVLPRAPVTSVTHIKTYDDSDTETTFSASNYYLDSAREPARVVLRTGETFPTALRVANAIEVKYVTGYTSQYSIPEPMKLGIMQHIAHLYEHRGDMYDASLPYPPMLRSLYAPYVIHRGMGSSSLMSLG